MGKDSNQIEREKEREMPTEEKKKSYEHGLNEVIIGKYQNWIGFESSSTNVIIFVH